MRSSMKGRLKFFQFLTILSKATISILYKSFCGNMFLFLLSNHLEVELVG